MCIENKKIRCRRLTGRVVLTPATDDEISKVERPESIL
jgi:hypothetical protein